MPLPPALPSRAILAPDWIAPPLLHRIGEAGATLGSRPPRRRAVRVALQAGLALLIFGFLVLTVANQWGELKEEGVRFTLIWLLPAFAVLMLFYVMSALGWDLLLRFLGNRLDSAARPGRLGPADAGPLRARAASSTSSPGSSSPSAPGCRGG